MKNTNYIEGNRVVTILFYETSDVGIKTALVHLTDKDTGILDMENAVNIKVG